MNTYRTKFRLVFIYEDPVNNLLFLESNSQVWTESIATPMSIIFRHFSMSAFDNSCFPYFNSMTSLLIYLSVSFSSDGWSWWNSKLVRNICRLVGRKVASEIILASWCYKWASKEHYGIHTLREVQRKTPKNWKTKEHPGNLSCVRYAHVHISNWSCFLVSMHMCIPYYRCVPQFFIFVRFSPEPDPLYIFDVL